jgi:hypothetical protein
MDPPIYFALVNQKLTIILLDVAYLTNGTLFRAYRAGGDASDMRALRQTPSRIKVPKIGAAIFS